MFEISIADPQRHSFTKPLGPSKETKMRTLFENLVRISFCKALFKLY